MKQLTLNISDSKFDTFLEFIKTLDYVEVDVPAWHKEIVQERLNEYETKKVEGMDFDTAIDDIENSL